MLRTGKNAILAMNLINGCCEKNIFDWNIQRFTIQRYLDMVTGDAHESIFFSDKRGMKWETR